MLAVSEALTQTLVFVEQFFVNKLTSGKKILLCL